MPNPVLVKREGKSEYMIAFTAYLLQERSTTEINQEKVKQGKKKKLGEQAVKGFINLMQPHASGQD